jgi:hypothetical protein
MNTNEIIQQLRQERSKLDAAIQALEGIGRSSTARKRRGRPPGSTNKATMGSANVVGAQKKRRRMSASARKRIAEVMRKRWAAAKKSGKKRL